MRTNKGALISRIAAVEARVHAAHEETFTYIVAANSIVLIVLLLLGVGHQAVLRRFSSRAIDQLLGAIQKIEDGRLSEPIRSSRTDEIGRILSSLDAMREQLNQRLIAEDSARQKAEDLSRSKSQFVASVSHELRTPLMGLLGMLDLARRHEDPDQIQKDLAAAKSSGTHLLDLVNQILDFSKIEAGKMELVEKPFSPSALIETVRSVFSVQASDKKLQFDLLSPSRGSPDLYGDPQRITQIVFNLVGNAIKFTDLGAVALHYNVEQRPDGRWRLRVDVIDTGPGIPADKQAEVFAEFAQVGDRSVVGKVGTGLGLTISNRLASLMGGEIGILPRKTGGAHFYFFVDLPEAEAEEPTAADPAQSEDVRLEPCKILITEDVTINRMIVSEFLKFDGHSVGEAENGAECLEQLAKDRFDVVLMDVNMPVMDGVEATRAIRRSPESWSAIPIVGLTANAFEDQVKDYLAAGMDACISKPVVQEELRSAIAQSIRKRQPAAAELV
ncbi:MAG: response regulator [Alphaproteobacteria bacterium]|nr:response regulator [Alphaproteobacteria bacterium]